MAAAIRAAAWRSPRPSARLHEAAWARLLAALQDGAELLVRLLQRGRRVGARQRRRQRGADDVAEFGNRNDDGQTELADLAGIDRRLQPFLRQLDALSCIGIAEDGVAERHAAT